MAITLAFLVLNASAGAANEESGKSTASATLAAEMAKREANKKTVLAFYEALVRLDFETARLHIGNYYVEHDPEREDGLPGLQKALDYDRRQGNRKRVVHELVVADGDFVAVYSRSLVLPRPAPKPSAPSRSTDPADASTGPPIANEPMLVGDIFRLQDGKIVEHWNAIYVP